MAKNIFREDLSNASIGSSVFTNSLNLAGASVGDILIIGSVSAGYGLVDTLTIGNNDDIMTVIGGLPGWSNQVNVNRVVSNTLKINSTQRGDLLVVDASGDLARLPSGLSGQVLTATGLNNDLNWQNINIVDPLILNDIQTNNSLVALNSFTTDSLKINGTVQGDLLTFNGSSTAQRVPIGTSGQILTTDGNVPFFQDLTFANPFVLPNITATNNLIGGRIYRSGAGTGNVYFTGDEIIQIASSYQEAAATNITGNVQFDFGNQILTSYVGLWCMVSIYLEVSSNTLGANFCEINAYDGGTLKNSTTFDSNGSSGYWKAYNYIYQGVSSGVHPIVKFENVLVGSNINIRRLRYIIQPM